MKKTKAFTLTELLVVVVIIGVLSAIVLPKFSKVLETRKTTEAEAMLMAVRGEQEARCTLDKPYVQEAHKDRLASLPSNTGNNYTYTLTGSGVTASSQDKDYELSIKSYEDGRICCSGTYCASLNKKYPSCEELPADNSGCGVADVGTSTNPCAGGDCEPEEPTGYECENGETKNVVRQCGKETGLVCQNNQWTSFTNSIEYTDAEKADCYLCDGSKPETSRDCPEGYEGNQSRTVMCDTSTGKWDVGEWSDLFCAEVDECEEDDTRDHEPYTECMNGCGEYIDICYYGTEWMPICQRKNSTECVGDQTKTETVTRKGIKYNVVYACESCRWVEKSSECGAGFVEIEGQCCKEGQIVKNGKCVYSYRPERINYNILVECAHGRDWEYENDNGTTTSVCSINQQVDCTTPLGNARRYYGGSAYTTNTLKTKNCYYSPSSGLGSCGLHVGGWSDGTTLSLVSLSNGQSEQDFCDQVCGSSTSCNAVAKISENYPTSCESFNCGGHGPFCGWGVGSGVGFRCVRN